MKSKHKIIWLNEVDSTNEEAKRHISVIDNLSVLTALSQTAGRGQRGNSWLSAPGENLTFSIVLKHPSIAASEQIIISDITAGSIVELLENHGIKAWIKPPNDIWVDKKKICGILIEHSLRGNRISWSIIGIGLNVNQTSFPNRLPNPTSMILESQGAEIQALLSEFINIFSNRASVLLQQTDSQP